LVNPVYMIAEIGINHNADLQIAKRLIDAAFACGWDCVKFQKRNPDICIPESQKQVMRKTPWGEMTYIDYKWLIEFGEEEYDYIDKYCKEKPIHWSASPWDLDSIQFLKNYDIPFIKIPSAMVTNIEYLEAIANFGKPVLLSTGMSTIEEIDNAVKILKNTDLALMHCNSTYPTPPNECNLRTITFLQNRYKLPVGYSGHEQGLEPSVIAASLGAKIIERHITLDHTMWGTDHPASLEIHAMDMLKKRIMEVMKCMGDGVKRVTDGEEKIREKLRG